MMLIYIYLLFKEERDREKKQQKYQIFFNESLVFLGHYVQIKWRTRFLDFNDFLSVSINSNNIYL